jgi:hypothetical protein
MKGLSYIISSSCIVGSIIPHNIHLANKHSTSHSHRDSNNRKVYHCEIQAAHANMLSQENIPP